MAKNAHGQTVDLLGEAIVSGRYPEGGAIPPEPVLGQELGVSRTVVREAIKALAAKGMVVTGPKVGSRVLPQQDWNWFDPDVITWKAKVGLTPQFLRDLQDLRRMVEPAAVRLAAERATAQDLAELEDAYAGMAQAVAARSTDYTTHDLRFHHGLLRAAGNLMLAQMSKALNALLRTSFEISSTLHNGPALSLPRHRAVLDAVRARDPDEAERAVLALIDSARADIEAVLGTQPPPRAALSERPTRRASRAPAGHRG